MNLYPPRYLTQAYYKRTAQINPNQAKVNPVPMETMGVCFEILTKLKEVI